MASSRIAIAFLHRTSSSSSSVHHHPRGLGIHASASSLTSCCSSSSFAMTPTSAASRSTYTFAPSSRSDPRRKERTTTTTATMSSEFHTSRNNAPFITRQQQAEERHHRAGSVAFGECEISALSDLFLQFAKTSSSKDAANDFDGGGGGGESGPYLNLNRIRLLLESVGERPDDETLKSLLDDVDSNGDGRLHLDCFLRAADRILGKAPARIVLVVGGPGSGKGELCRRLADTCGAVHLSCGEMLREEVASRTPLGREVSDIMARGDLVSSAVVTALMRRRMRRHPGRRILLDGFPRSLENARDFVELCGPPELALHLNCDDTVMIERILSRAAGGGSKDGENIVDAASSSSSAVVRSDDNVHTAIQRLKNYHKHHGPTMSWLKEIRVPIVELDCSGTKEDVWGQLTAIGRLMRPAVKLPLQQQQQQRSSDDVVERHPRSQPPMQEVVYGGVIRNKTFAGEDMQWIA